MGSQIPSHHTDVATAMGTGDSFLCDGGGKRLKFEKLFIQPTPLKVCTCNCAKSSKTAATSPMIKPPKNCAFSLCATSRRTGKCLRLSGNRRPIHLPSCSVNVLQTMSFHCVCKTFTEQAGKWIGRLFPDNRRHFPVLLDVAQSEKAQFFGGLIIGEVAAVFDDFAQLHVQTFNGVGCINHFSNFRRFPPPSQRKESPVPIAVATSV